MEKKYYIILKPTALPMRIRDKRNAAAHATAAWLVAQYNTIPAILENDTPSCNINSDPDLDCEYGGGVNCDWSDSDSEYEDYTDTYSESLEEIAR